MLRLLEITGRGGELRPLSIPGTKSHIIETPAKTRLQPPNIHACFTECALHTFHCTKTSSPISHLIMTAGLAPGLIAN